MEIKTQHIKICAVWNAAKAIFRGKPLARLTKKKRKKTQISIIKNERRHNHRLCFGNSPNAQQMINGLRKCNIYIIYI
jgi:hypothetical protein